MRLDNTVSRDFLKFCFIRSKYNKLQRKSLERIVTKYQKGGSHLFGTFLTVTVSVILIECKNSGCHLFGTFLTVTVSVILIECKNSGCHLFGTFHRTSTRNRNKLHKRWLPPFVLNIFVSWCIFIL